MKIVTPLFVILFYLLRHANAVETINVLVFLVQWANHDSRTLIPGDQIEQIWNGPSNDPNIVPGESVSDYLTSNSYGKYNVQAEVIDWYKVTQTEEEASNGKMGYSVDGKYIEDVFLPALEAAVDSGVDLSKYDRGGKELKGVVIIHSGYAAELGGTDCETGADYLNRIVSKSWDTSRIIGQTNFHLVTFATLSAYRRTCDLEINRIGGWVPEFLKAQFDLESLYDTGGRYNGSRVATGGIGAYGIMSYSSGQKYMPEYPGILSPYIKMQIGALNPIEITADGIYTARPSALYPDVYMIKGSYPSGEYLLIENRQPLLSDKNMWEPGGILIWHIDENAEGNGNFVRGGPFVDGWPGNGAHYKVAVLQADGKYELEMALNLGHIDDFWKAGDILGPGNGESVATSAGTYPNTDGYSSGNIIVTGLIIDLFTEVSPSPSNWSFRIQNLVTSEPTKVPSQAPSPLTDVPTAMPTHTSVNCFPTAYTDPVYQCDCMSDCQEVANFACNCPEAITCCAASGSPSVSSDPTMTSIPTPVPTKTAMPSMATTTTGPTIEEKQCIVTVSTNKCDDMMKNGFTKDNDCQCYNFCSGSEISCCPFGNDCKIDCQGELVAGCQALDPTPYPTPVPNVGDKCLVSVNTQNCQSLLSTDITQVPHCDCYNFCNGNLLNCCPEGQLCGMECDGSVVAGCAFEEPATMLPTPASEAPTPTPQTPTSYLFWPDNFLR